MMFCIYPPFFIFFSSATNSFPSFIFSAINGMTVTMEIAPMRMSPCMREAPTKRGARKYQESAQTKMVSTRFFVKNAKSNPLEYTRVALSERYQIGIQESPTASAEPTTP